MKKLLYIFIFLPLFIMGQTIEDFGVYLPNPEITGTIIFPAPSLLDYAGKLVQAYESGQPVGPALTISDNGACGIAAFQSFGANDLADPGDELGFAILVNDSVIIIVTVNPPVTFASNMQVILNANALSFSPLAPGCTYSSALNFNSLANVDDGSCQIEGCTDSSAFNYYSDANIDDGSCVPVFLGCIDLSAFNYNLEANTDDGSCIPVIQGCLDPSAFNFNSDANTDDDESCMFIDPISYEVSSGWNMVGYTGCEITPIEEAFQGALGNGSSLEETFVIIKDLRGRMWHPELGENSLLTHLTPGEGYMMFVREGQSTNLTFSEQYCNDISYQLNSGWNMVAITGDPTYGYNNIIEIMNTALAANGAYMNNTFQIIKDVSGRFWTPYFSQLNELTNGEAYMMYVLDGRETTISFTGNSTQVFGNNPGVEFTLPVTDNNMSVIFPAGSLSDFAGYEMYVSGEYGYNEGLNSSENYIINEDGSVGIAVIGMDYMCQNCDQLPSSGDQLNFYITSADGTSINLELDPPESYINNYFSTLDNNYHGFSFTIDGNPVVNGCTDATYIEYNPSANLDDGSCQEILVAGCTDSLSCEYNQDANFDDGSCIYETEQSLFNTCCLNNLVTSICPSEEDCASADINCINLGCMSSWADNFDIFVTQDDGSCFRSGCTLEWADNYDDLATDNDGSCYKYGCTENWADNFDDLATNNDGSCYKYGCTEDWADNYDSFATNDDGSCSLESCTSTWADNYDSNATVDDGSCYKYGCTNVLALNYDEFVTDDDGSCDYEIVTQLSLSFDAWNISIDLQEGWNMFGYGCPIPIDLAQGLSDHTENIIITKDNNGRVYIPDYDFNGIGDFTPGFGYQVKLKQAIVGFNLCTDYINAVMTNDLQSIVDELSTNSDSLLQMNHNIVSLQEENAYLQTELGCYENPQVGDYCFGGIVFYLDETSQHGLVAALENLTEGAADPMGFGTPGYEWGCYNQDVNGADATSIGTGYQNSLEILNQSCTTEYGGMNAAQVAMNYQSGWYLPSKDELVEMYNTIGHGSGNNIGNFEGWYCSSSEIDSIFFWVVNFNHGQIHDEGNKMYRAHVRPIRSF